MIQVRFPSAVTEGRKRPLASLILKKSEVDKNKLSPLEMRFGFIYLNLLGDWPTLFPNVF